MITVEQPGGSEGSDSVEPVEIEPTGAGNEDPTDGGGESQVAGEAEGVGHETEGVPDEGEGVSDGAKAVGDGAESVADEVESVARAEAEPENSTEEEGPQPPAAPAPAPSPPPTSEARPAHVRPRHTPPSRDLADAWVVEMWVDPDWYAVQQTDEACPSAGVPDIVVVRRNVVLVGRPSGSLGVRPDVDAGADSAVSRRHAQLTSDGTRWWIEDLGSSNGTFVGVVGDPLPTEPLTPGQRVEIDRDDRIYVGAWTRLVIRQATESEKAGEG